MLDNTARDGYYYMYVTSGICHCYRSKNLMDWEDVGNTVVGLTGWTDIWAPEVVYDEDTKLYYMFFSATPPDAGDVKYQMLLATSKNPDKGFELVDFTDIHYYDASTYSQDNTKYFYLDPAKYQAFAKKNGGVSSEVGGYERAIDPHPYVDSDGKKYLLWTDNSKKPNRICGVPMKDNNWMAPDWENAEVLIEGAVSEDIYRICEGPELIYHNDKYYLTYSIGLYGTNGYQVRQAVSDSVLGTYTKLKEDEGGILLKGYYQSGQGITGTGHHSFVTVGEQLYMVYHRHDTSYNASDKTGGGSSRNIAIDEVKWITNKNGMDIMYVNGPTRTVQPVMEQFSAFKNIAGEAQVSGDGVTNLSSLTDGLLSIYGTDKESSIRKTTTVIFDFDTTRVIGGVMVYNSSDKDMCFRNIAKIECVCIENGHEVTRVLQNIAFDSNYFTDEGVILGAAAYTTMEEWNVKSMRITIEVSDGQEQVGISEIKILGKK